MLLPSKNNDNICHIFSFALVKYRSARPSNHTQSCFSLPLNNSILIPLFLNSILIMTKYSFTWVVHNFLNALSLDIEVVTILPIIKWVTVVASTCALGLGCFQFQVSVTPLKGWSSVLSLQLPQHSLWHFPPLAATLILASAIFPKYFSYHIWHVSPLGESSSKFKKIPSSRFQAQV